MLLGKQIRLLDSLKVLGLWRFLDHPLRTTELDWYVNHAFLKIRGGVGKDLRQLNPLVLPMIDLCIRGSYYKLLLSPPQPTHVCNFPVTVHFFDLAVLSAGCRTTWRALNTHAQAPSRPTGSEFGGHKPSVLCVLFYLLIPELPQGSLVSQG